MNLLRDVSLDALMAFAEFAEDGNFTRAAGRLHLSQPALHTRISKLGEAVGRPLYVRRGRGIEITPVGRQVQRFARELAASAAVFQSELQGQDVEPTVVLAAGEGATLYLLGQGIRAHLAHRRHSLQLLTADGAVAVEAVRSGRAQLGVACLETVPKDLTVLPLTRVGQVLAMPRRHPLSARRKVKLTDLQSAELIVPPEGRPHRVMLSRLLQSAGVDFSVAVEATGWEVMLHLVRLGMGLAVVNACCRLPAGVVSRPMPELPSLQYHLFHRNGGVTGAAATLRQNLLAQADAWRDSR
ncbi:LysR family transcriptional regulator [Stenotrophomonas sp.]|uniref:LysR family transcriptional regulator n=1 Tax=Stenotrophomonas sp. TaxID=69392 RepID=UPI0028A1DA34|nr:LysR family transcriptional regulator [Stenotrophomonas sp.]